jgi:hypothetical protein
LYGDSVAAFGAQEVFFVVPGTTCAGSPPSVVDQPRTRVLAMTLSTFHRLALGLVLLVAPACATEFTGAPHYPGGPRACHADCARQNMEMSSFVYSGEFASSCVCRPRPARTSPPPAGSGAPGARSDRDDEDDAAAAIGVVMQQRRAAQQRGAAAGAHR